MRSPTLHHGLALIESQRTPVLQRMTAVPLRTLWQSPPAAPPGTSGASAGWSAGQWLEHLVRTLRLQRRGLALWVPLARPFATRVRHRPFARDLPDPFQLAQGAGKAPAPGPFAGTRVPDRSASPLPLAALAGRLAGETSALRRVLDDVEDDVAGHVKVWDGPSGWINLHQVVRNIAHHERNDLAHIRAVLDAVGAPA